MPPSVLILRRRYPRSVTFTDLRTAFGNASPWPSVKRAERIAGNVYPKWAAESRAEFHARLKA